VLFKFKFFQTVTFSYLIVVTYYHISFLFCHSIWPPKTLWLKTPCKISKPYHKPSWDKSMWQRKRKKGKIITKIVETSFWSHVLRPDQLFFVSTRNVWNHLDKWCLWFNFQGVSQLIIQQFLLISQDNAVYSDFKHEQNLTEGHFGSFGVKNKLDFLFFIFTSNLSS
jgi:hypothetical protein